MYEQFRDKNTGRIIMRYIGPLHEIVRVYEIVKQGNYVKLRRRELTTLARKIASYYARGLTVVNAKHKRSLNNRKMEPPAGFEPATTGLRGRRSTR